MKRIKYLLFIGAFIALAGNLHAQQGELDRFSSDRFNNANEIRLYPNPTVEYLRVRINNSTIKAPKLVVHNIIGNVVEAEIKRENISLFSVKVKDLAPGYYLIAIRDEQGSFAETYKFMKR